MHKHIRYIAVAIAAATVVGLAGCTGGSANDGAVTVTLLTADPQTNLQPAIDGFEKANPDITVEYEYVPFDQFNNTIESRVGGGDAGVDVYAADSGAIGSLASKGYLLDLSEFADTVASDSLPATLDANSYGGKLWSIPLWTSMQYLYYNKDILDAAGIPYPSGELDQALTYQQLLDDGKKAQAAGATWGLLIDQINRYYQLQALIESAGGGSGASGDNLLTADINNAGWVAAMDWYSQLFADGVAPRGIATEQMGPLFASGEAAFTIAGPWQVTTNLAADKVINYGIAPNPVFEGGKPAMSTGSWNLGINPATDQPEASKKLVEYLGLTKEGNALSASVVGTSPTNIEAFADFVAGLDDRDAPNTAGLGALTTAELKSIAVNRPNSPGFTQMADVTGRAFDDIRNGQPVQSTLDDAQAELQGLWDRLK